MRLKILTQDFSICRLSSPPRIRDGAQFVFVGVTDEEYSLVCPTNDVPEEVLAHDDGWRAFRIEGVLDFSLVGILACLSGILAARGIGIFAVSTFNTDYILTKEESFPAALAALSEAGYEIAE